MEKPRQLPSGTWQQRVTGPDGNRRSALGETERKAQKAGALLLAELESKHAANQKLDETKTLFSRYAEEHLWSRRPGEINGYAPTSYYKRQHDLKELNKVFGDRYLEQIRPSEIRAGLPAHRGPASRRAGSRHARAPLG